MFLFNGFFINGVLTKFSLIMSLKLLTKLSHFITMMFGVALGMALCILYQFKVNLFIESLSPIIMIIIIIGLFLRGYTLIIWKKNDYSSKIFNN